MNRPIATAVTNDPTGARAGPPTGDAATGRRASVPLGPCVATQLAVDLEQFVRSHHARVRVRRSRAA